MKNSGYEEHIISEYEYENKTLRARVARLEEVLRFILDECDWEDDKRIGAAARRALEEK